MQRDRVRTAVGLMSAFFVLALATFACIITPVPVPATTTPESPPTVTPTPAVIALAPAELARVLEAARVVEQAYVATGAATREQVETGALDAMLKAADVQREPFLSQLYPENAPLPPEVPQWLARFFAAWQRLLEGNPSLKAEDLALAAMRGMLQASGDPAAAAIPAKEMRETQEFLAGQYEGIGAVVALMEGRVVIQGVVPGGPAQEAGLQPGDVLLAVDGKPVAGLELSAVVKMVKGPADSQVMLQLQRGQAAPIEVAVTRRHVETPTVDGGLLPNDIGYLYIARFSDRTGQEFVAALKELTDLGIRGLVLDMRANIGGSLEAAVTVVSQFVKAGLVYYEVDMAGKRQDSSVTGEGTLLKLPLVVLVDEETRSAAEVVAGALQDHGRAAILGTITYGTGTLHGFSTLADGTVLYVAASRWYTPNGHSVEGTGLRPDQEVVLTAEDIAQRSDRQLFEAYRYLLRKIELLESATPRRM